MLLFILYSNFNSFLVFNFPFFNFEQYLISFSLEKYSLLIFNVVLHFQLNASKIPKMVYYNNRSLMILVNDAKYIHRFPIFRRLSRAFHIASINH